MLNSTPIKELTRVGKTTSARLKKLGLETVEDLMFYFPFRYDDFSHLKKIAELMPDEPVTIRGKIQMIAGRKSFRTRKFITEALVADDSASLKVVWFNQPFLAKVLKVGDEIFLSGKIEQNRFEMISPDYEKVSIRGAFNTARIVPVYHLTDGVTQKQLRFLLSQVIPLMRQIKDYLPASIRSANKFLNLSESIINAHFPETFDKADQARRRLKFDELFLIQLAIMQFREKLDSNRAPQIAFLEKQTRDYVASLPFQLTGAQKKCSWEIIKDLGKENPMNRLLEGDVGSGKTVVVSLAILNAALNGYKTVLMAPTEILAHQHYLSFRKFFQKQNFHVALLAAGKRDFDGEKLSKADMLEKLENAEADLVVGTHALIQENVKIKDLGLVIVDEQHRFGVEQRKTLLARDKTKEFMPHFLSMTATPIPRSLVLALYGDLDLSIINEMPKGRKPIITKVVFEDKRFDAYQFIRKQIEEGRQVFVICPLIDPSDTLGLKSVTEEHQRLSNEIFPDLKIGLMHGRLKPKDKDEVMKKFKDKEFDILVSTSVIEVGIDVPNSTIMMIEGADRFGLAQLHQFRGRVGRGEYQSYCFLFTNNNSPLTRKRLGFMETCRDGFALSEKDLELRGPGEVYGTRQSGLPDLKIASLADVEIIELAQIEAKRVLAEKLMTEELKKVLERTRVSMHFE
jgi:ATP-dependent DNA helicase RecG